MKRLFDECLSLLKEVLSSYHKHFLWFTFGYLVAILSIVLEYESVIFLLENLRDALANLRG